MQKLKLDYEDSIRESENIVVHDCDDDVDDIQQEEGNTELEWTLKKYRVSNNNIDDT